MNNNVIIGIDTSNYTTSVAVSDEEGNIIANAKKLLPVREGECGLRQSDAVFAHVKNFPFVMDEVRPFISDKKIVAIGVSSRPRRVEGSYMPCFLTGVAIADSLSAVCDAPVFEFSHQCGHIMSAVYSSGKTELLNGEFGVFHLSGGTTELLLTKFNKNEFNTEIVGGTKDINAGQLIDRVGVMLGLRFPCGAELEKLALKNERKVKVPKINTDACFINLSGVENLGAKVYKETDDASYTAAYVFEYLSQAIFKISRSFTEKYGEIPILYAGGVMSNSIIKGRLASENERYFAEPKFSSDNAAGIALLARNAYLYN